MQAVALYISAVVKWGALSPLLHNVHILYTAVTECITVHICSSSTKCKVQ